MALNSILEAIFSPHKISGRRLQRALLQGHFVLSQEDQAFAEVMPQATPSFIRVMTKAIRTGRHRKVGALIYNILERCFDLANFKTDTIGVEPTPFQTAVYCSMLHLSLDVLCPGFETEELDFEELLAWPSSEVGSVIRRDDCPLRGNVIRGIVIGLRSTFREEMTFSQRWRMASGFEHAHRKGCSVVVPASLIEMREPPPPEVPEDMYRNIGPPIDTEMFCQSTSTVPTGTVCSICIADVTSDADEADQKPVVTTCGHYFHEQCLDAWVNDSAMSKSHTCPSCRAVMCEARPRIPEEMPPQD
jgi:hypothetical protein